MHLTLNQNRKNIRKKIFLQKTKFHETSILLKSTLTSMQSVHVYHIEHDRIRPRKTMSFPGLSGVLSGPPKSLIAIVIIKS